MAALVAAPLSASPVGTLSFPKASSNPPDCPFPPICPQAQTAELRSSIDSIKQLVAALEAQNQKAAAAEAGGGSAAGAGSTAGVGDGLTVADLRQELRSFAETLQE